MSSPGPYCTLRPSPSSLSHRQGPAGDVLEGQGQLGGRALVPIAPFVPPPSSLSQRRGGQAGDVLEGQGQLGGRALVPIAACKEMNLRLSKISFLRIFEAIFGLLRRRISP